MQGICWQYIIKEKLRRKNNPTAISGLEKIEISPISYKVAKEFITTYEWLGNMGTSKYCFGLFLDEKLASVVCYGPAVAPTKYCNILGKVASRRIMQLCRGASAYWAPKWAPSKLISLSLKLLKYKHNINIVIAYADPTAGEIGTIYQACNAFYIGKTSPGGGKRYIIHGHSYDPRKVHKKFGSRAQDFLKKIDPDYKTHAIIPKHRYLFIVDKKLKKKLLSKIECLLEKYPKRVATEPGDGSAGTPRPTPN